MIRVSNVAGSLKVEDKTSGSVMNPALNLKILLAHPGR